jgi:ferrous iron transport protein A
MTIDTSITGTSSRLSEVSRGARGSVTGLVIDPADTSHGVSAEELERRLLEIGFVEGAAFEVLHIGLFGGDPIAVRLNETRVALRKREARAIAVRIEP